nr:MAG TPA: hypothetical protein [Caudoviricetes sp.]
MKNIIWAKRIKEYSGIYIFYCIHFIILGRWHYHWHYRTDYNPRYFQRN